MFAIRAALAATLSPTWGVYSGFELYEHEPQEPGSEEYLHSEKFELRPRDWAAALEEGRSLEPWITRLNEIRRAHPALQQMRTLRFHDVDHDALVAYSKRDPATGDTVRRDRLARPARGPRGHDPSRHAGPRARLGRPDHRPRRGHRARRTSGAQHNYVRLDPCVEPSRTSSPSSASPSSPNES